MISFLHISKIYGKRKKIIALDDVSFEIKRGEFVTIVGPSGAGKSTLVRLLICEEKPTAGKISVGGYDITKLTPFEIPYFRRKIGVVFQDFKLLPQKSVAENTAYALEVCGYPDSEIKRRVPKVLEMVSLTDRAKNIPQELSGGEKQRTAIARALVHGPKLIIADEPTGNLDPKTSWEIIELLIKINDRGTMVLLATHNKDIVNSLGRRVVTIKNGQLVSDEAVGRYRVWTKEILTDKSPIHKFSLISDDKWIED